MSVPGTRRRPSTEGDDPISLLQATLDREETRRRVRALRAAVAAVAVLAVIVVAAVLWRGESAAADRAAVSPQARAQIAALAASAAAAEARAAEASATRSLPTTPDSIPAPAPALEEPVVPPPADVKPSQSSRKGQRFPIAIGVAGFEPAVITASASSPIVLSVARGEGCAAGFLIPGLDVAEDNSAGPVTVSLGRVPAGSYQYSCGMEMVTGTLIVK